MDNQLLTTNRKALQVNLDLEKYGTLAEIGAGQEVARYFFQAGGAAGTIAKSISAYDMKFSDDIYGKSPRYVSRERLSLMLDHEYDLLVQRLGETRGATSTFFVFADTVSARNFRGTNECHGWMGLRFQREPHAAPSDIHIHVRMWDRENVLQQQALGIAGVNLIYGGFYYKADPEKFIRSLIDNLSTERIEVDMIRFSGPDFTTVDNRLMSLLLVQHGLTNAVLFGPNHDVIQPSELLYKKSILVERGSFRPVTNVNMDMLDCALAQFVQEPAVKNTRVEVLLEITMHNLLSSGELDHLDFLARVDAISALGHNVLISNYSEYYRLTSYFRRYTKEMIGVALGINNLLEVFNEKYYETLEGGILESFGRLFRNAVKLFVYPMRQSAYDYYTSTQRETVPGGAISVLNHAHTKSVLIKASNLQVPPNLSNLYLHLQENGYIECIVGYDTTILDIFSRDVLKKIASEDASWEGMVPPQVATLIKDRGLFGYQRALPAAAE
ncbi:MAG TPA: TonB-dependent receptor [Chthoniobacterales bacterium]|jgi:hypothetical protein